MSTMAIIGAGPGLGAAVARRFGAAGHDIALISRSREHVDALAATLRGHGVTANGYTADVHDPATLVAALDQAAHDLGPVEVLQYSPVPAQDYLQPVLDTTPAQLAAAIEFSLLGPVAAIQQILPGMRHLGSGTVLLVNGSSAVRPNPSVAGTSTAFAAESAYAQMLHTALAGEHIHVGQLIVPGGITPGHPQYDPDVLAQTLWEMHTDRDIFRVLAGPLPD